MLLKLLFYLFSVENKTWENNHWDEQDEYQQHQFSSTRLECMSDHLHSAHESEKAKQSKNPEKSDDEESIEVVHPPYHVSVERYDRHHIAPC